MNFIFKPIRKTFSSLPLVLCLLAFLTVALTPVYSQKRVGVLGQSGAVPDAKPPLTLNNILKVLNLEKVTKDGVETLLTPAERNTIALLGIKSRGGVAFVMTPAVEERLRTAGATDALIDAIRRSAAKLQDDPIKINNIAARYLQLGDSAKASRQYDEAIDNYNNVIELDPNKREAFNQRGIVYQSLGQNQKILGDAAMQQKNTEEATTKYTEANKNYEKAIDDFSKAISIDPTGRNGYYNRGVCFYEKPTNNNLEETKANARKAVDDFTKAIEIDAKFKEAYLNRANTYRYKLGDAAKADADLQKIKEINAGAGAGAAVAQPVATDAKP